VDEEARQRVWFIPIDIICNKKELEETIGSVPIGVSIST
jgi:hypothetical protein